MGADGRAYTAEQAAIVQTVLKAKEGGRGAHYRVLSIRSTANEAEIKVRGCVGVGCVFWLEYT